MSRIWSTPMSLCLVMLALVGAGCDSSDSDADDKPAYINGTLTGQYGINDLGFYLGARTDPVAVTTETDAPVLKFDIGNGFYGDAQNVAWRVFVDGVLYDQGVVDVIAWLEWADIEVPVDNSAPGSAVYRIEIDPANLINEANENNNWVEVTIEVLGVSAG